jgi:hypothetical protein
MAWTVKDAPPVMGPSSGDRGLQGLVQKGLVRDGICGASRRGGRLARARGGLGRRSRRRLGGRSRSGGRCRSWCNVRVRSRCQMDPRDGRWPRLFLGLRRRLLCASEPGLVGSRCRQDESCARQGASRSNGRRCGGRLGRRLGDRDARLRMRLCLGGCPREHGGNGPQEPEPDTYKRGRNAGVPRARRRRPEADDCTAIVTSCGSALHHDRAQRSVLRGFACCHVVWHKQTTCLVEPMTAFPA